MSQWHDTSHAASDTVTSAAAAAKSRCPACVTVRVSLTLSGLSRHSSTAAAARAAASTSTLIMIMIIESHDQHGEPGSGSVSRFTGTAVRGPSVLAVTRIGSESAAGPPAHHAAAVNLITPSPACLKLSGRATQPGSGRCQARLGGRRAGPGPPHLGWPHRGRLARPPGNGMMS